MGSCFSICMGSSPPSRLLPTTAASSSHTYFTHHQLSFQPSSFTYHLHTPSSTQSLTHLCQSLSFTYHLSPPSFTHHLSTTIFHIPSFTHLCQPPSFTPSSSELFHFRGIQVDSNHSDSKPRATMRSKWRWYFASQSRKGQSSVGLLQLWQSRVEGGALLGWRENVYGRLQTSLFRPMHSGAADPKGEEIVCREAESGKY